MSTLETVVKRIPALQSTQSKYIATNIQVLSQLEQELNRIEEISHNPTSESTATQDLDIVSKKLSDGFKEYHAQISKFSKELDKVVEDKGDGCDTRIPGTSQSGSTIAMRRLVMQYLCRRALPQATRSLSASSWRANETCDSAPMDSGEISLDLAPGAQIFLQEMPAVMDGVRRRDIRPAEEWVFTHRNQLGRLATYDLTFQITRIRFLQLLEEPFSDDMLQRSLQFAERRLSVFHPQYEADIQSLLHLLLIYGKPPVSRLDQSPSPNSPISQRQKIVSIQEYIDQLGEQVLMQCSKINALPGDGHYSNFEILLNTGRAAASIVNTALQFVSSPDEASDGHVAKRQKNLFDLEASGLPVDFKIKPERRYHSVFCCPVSRQPATVSDPPVLLSCGHAILMSSMKSLPRRSNKFKCPTCYGQSEESQVITLTIF